ncbi:MAG: hypothetical protein JSW60_07250 [Thermoplasmatales archaeon]|nr:MAG: hypothetical protein JSW60_07250 [Thermoplasmatales archaeon]
MVNLETRNIIIAGFIVGIALFFIGAIIINVFPSSESNLLSYKVSAIIKLIGIGILTSSMVVGGVIVKGIDKNQKTLLLVIGLILLIIYSIGSQSLQWEVEKSGKPLVNESYEERPTGYGLPGFELIPVVIAIAFVLFWRRRRTG